MPLTQEMSRMGAQFESAEAARLAAVAAIRPALKRELQKGRMARVRALSACRHAAANDLKEIYGAAAVIRGTAEDMVDRFARDLRKKAAAMHDFLQSCAEELHEAVEEQMEHLTKARHVTARREAAARRNYVKDLRRRVETMLHHADTFMTALHAERADAERHWRQHCRNEKRIRAAGGNGHAAALETAPPTRTKHKQTAHKRTSQKKTTIAKKKRKTARH